MLRVLLTNDDGVRAAGILAIRAALTGVCASVVTVAPDGNRSGFARKCTFDRPVGVRRLEGGPHPVYECDGTPTDCVRAGLLGGLAAEADLVVSGINHGANVADDVVYSGTVGAGLEAAVLGTSALCLSQQTPTGSLSVNYTDAGDYDFGLAARHGAGLTATILAARPAETVVLSINYPAGPPAPARRPRPGGRRPGGRPDPPRAAHLPAGPAEGLGHRSRAAGVLPVRRPGRGHPRGRRPGGHRRRRAAPWPHLGDPAVRGGGAGGVLARDDVVPGPAARPGAMAGAPALTARGRPGRAGHAGPRCGERGAAPARARARTGRQTTPRGRPAPPPRGGPRCSGSPGRGGPGGRAACWTRTRRGPGRARAGSAPPRR